jgi:hypothetical protein
VEQSQRLAELDDVRIATIVRASRDELLRTGPHAVMAAHGFAYPFLVRSPGFHNGYFFELVADDAAFTAAIAAMPNDDVLVMTYQDTRGADGMVRKYRVMTIGGRLYPVHLAVSTNWKVHYVSSAMAGNAAFRAEEAAFLADMSSALGTRVVNALAAVAESMHLDYGGIDFGIARDGTLVVFEANAAMGVFLPDADPRWDYRRGAMTRALRAATELLVRRATTESVQKPHTTIRGQASFPS